MRRLKQFAICVLAVMSGTMSPLFAVDVQSTLPQNTITVRGVVTDIRNNPIIGAMVLQKGVSNNASVTGATGEYTLTVGGEHETLEFRMMGYKTVEAAANRTRIDVVMEEEATSIDDVVVVGYAVQKRKDLTGAAASLSATDSKLTVVTSLDQMMQGNLSGVNVINSSGTPGGAVSISIRGIGSINGSNSPLFVIDGIPVVNNDRQRGIDGNFGGYVQDPLSMLNPADIETIDVLKDAAATAIYGSRATNGVVMVTTKKGRTGQRSTVNLSAYYGLQSLPKRIEMADSQLYLETRNEAINNFNTQNGLVPGDNNYRAPEVNLRPGEPDEDWIKLVTHDYAQVQDYNVSVQGGGEKTRFYSSMGYFDQQGIILTNRFRRYSFHTSVDHDISRIFKTGVSIDLSHTVNNLVPNDNTGNGIFVRSIEQRPFDHPRKPDGSYSIGGVDVPRHNGIIVLNEQRSLNRWYRALANAWVSVDFTDWLRYKIAVSGDVRYSNDYLKLTKDHPYGSPKGQISDFRSLDQNYLIDNTLSFNKNFDDFSLTALAGYSYQEMNDNVMQMVGKDFPSPNFDYINAAGYIQSGSTSGGANSLSSGFMRVNASWKDRYLLSASIRADGSSKFAVGNKWGTFPAVSAAWRISGEEFMSHSRTVSDLKLRVSWGLTGNQAGIGNYASRSLASGGQNYNGNDGIAVTSLANPDLRWEKADQFDVGLDAAFMGGRFSLSADFFIKNTRDLLYDRPLHTTTGYSAITQNIGGMRNTGFELNLSSVNVSRSRFYWKTAFNISFIRNKLTSLIDENPIPVGNHVLKVGESIGSFYMYRMEGIYQTDGQVPAPLFASGVRAGDIRYHDENGDGQLTADDKVIVGRAMPDYHGGLTNTLTFGNFDLTIFNTFSVGNKVYASGMGGIDAVGQNNYGIRKEVAANRWRGEGTSDTIPRAMINTHNTQASTYLLRNGSYFKFKDVTVGYTLPAAWTAKASISRVRLYVTAQNLWTISNYPGYDPEVSYSISDSRTMGLDLMTVPQLRTFLFGFNITF